MTSETVVSTKIDRIHLLTRKDIVNKEKAYGIKGVERHVKLLHVESLSASIYRCTETTWLRSI